MAKNSYVETEQHLHITANSLLVDSEDDMTVMFQQPVVITDDTTQKNGTSYDIPSLDISKFRGKLWANHDVDRFENALAKVIGLRKNENTVTIDGLKFFRSNGYSWLARDLMLEGAADEFSIGTQGPEPDKNGVYFNHTMYEFSLVGIGNNDNAHINGTEQLASLAVQNGFDLKKYKLESNVKTVSVKNSQSFDVSITYKNEAGEDTEQVVKAGEEVQVPEEQKEAVETQISEAEAPKKHVEKPVATVEVEPKNSIDYDQLATKVAEKMAASKKEEPAKPNFKNSIEEKPKMTKKVENSFETMSPAQRFVEAAKLERNGLKGSEEYNALNDLAKADYKNTLGDTELGALIAPPTLLPDPTKCAPKYQEFLTNFRFQKGALAYSLNNLYSNVRFVVAGCGVPATQSGADINNLIVTQETLRTYTPICNKNIEFSAVDIENLFENEYQNAFDRALVEYAIGQFEVAVDTRVAGYTLSTGKVIAADTSASIAYPASSVVGKDRAAALAAWVDDVKECADGTVIVMTKASVRKVVADLVEGGVLTVAGGLNVNQKSLLETVLDTDIVIVPKGTLPTVGSGSTVTIDREGASDITVHHAMFAISPDNFLGLYAPMTFDVDSQSSYEVLVEGEGTDPDVIQVRSPKLYDETVLWGRMHRGGGVRDLRFVAGVRS